MSLHKFIPQPCFDGASDSGASGRSGARGAESGNNQRGGFSGGAGGTPGSMGGGVRGNEADTGRNERVGAYTTDRSTPTGFGTFSPTTRTVSSPTAQKPSYTSEALPSIPAALPVALQSMAPPPGMLKSPSGYASLDAMANAAMQRAAMQSMATADLDTASRLGALSGNLSNPTAAKNVGRMGPMDSPSTVSSSGYGSLADRAAIGTSGLGMGPGGVGGVAPSNASGFGAVSSRNAGGGAPVGAGGMGANNDRGPSFSGGPQSGGYGDIAAQSNTAAKGDYGQAPTGPQRSFQDTTAGQNLASIGRTIQGFAPGLFGNPAPTVSANKNPSRMQGLSGYTGPTFDPNRNMKQINDRLPGAVASQAPAQATRGSIMSNQGVSVLGLGNEALNMDPATRNRTRGLLNAAQSPEQLSGAFNADNRPMPAGLPQARAAATPSESVNVEPTSAPAFRTAEDIAMDIYGPDMAAAIASTDTDLSNVPGAYSNINNTSEFTDATDIAQDVVTGNYSGAISKTIDRFGLGTAMQIAGLLSGAGNGLVSGQREQDRQAGISRGGDRQDTETVKRVIAGILNSAPEQNPPTAPNPPVTTQPWTPPGLLNRSYSNPWATRNPWLNV